MTDSPYVPPLGSQVPLDFGQAYTPPIGSAVPLEFARGEGPVGDTQYLFPVVFNPSAYGIAYLRLQRDFITPPGFNAFQSGQATVWRFHSYARPTGIAPPPLGAPGVMNKHRPVAPSGFESMAAGNPSIINRNRYVAAGNIAAPIWGANPVVWHYTRYLRPGGLSAALYGATVLTHGRRYIQMQGGIPAPGVGVAWVSQGTRVLAPVSAFLDAVGRPLVGGTRYLTPAGWDSQAFGTRIIPESQTLLPQGFREIWGQAGLFNWLSIARPVGFQTTGQEQYRWGMPHAYNLRQYVAQEHDPNDGLNPPPWTGWTAIANRNRVIGAIGVQPALAGIPQLDNNARLLAPPGLNPPGVATAGMVSYGVRRLPLEGIEAPLILGWHALHNDARVLAATGAEHSTFGTAALVNTRRFYDRIGAIDSAEYGLPMIADAIRHIAIEPRYGIGPPIIQQPEVKQHTRYVDGIGNDLQAFGAPSLSIHFRHITPRWAHRDYFGEPRAFNVTPELRGYGWNSEDFGAALVRLQWRPVAPDGNNMQLFGRARIADRTQGIVVPGVNMLRLGDKLNVVKTGAPPYSQQNIIADQVMNSASAFGTPGLNQFVLRPSGVVAPQAGSPAVRIMGANVDAGIKVDGYGTPTVDLKVRTLVVAEWNDSQVFQPAKPRLSPHTIWAVKEAPQQARENHPAGSLHYVGETNIYQPGERFGNHRISTYRNNLRPNGIGPLVLGVPVVALRRRYILPIGLQAYRMGWTVIGDGSQFVTQFGGTDSMRLGAAAVMRAPYTGPQTVRPGGIVAPSVGAYTWASLLHRALPLAGFDALRMGSSRGDSPYQWQTLHVGPLMPTIPAGFLAEKFGTAWVSMRVRGVELGGWDALEIGYDPAKFAERLRVRNAYVPPGPPAQAVTPMGIGMIEAGVPNVRPGVHYIRPDGNADQYRKGAF